MTTMARRITGGVDTHLDVHVAAALDGIGGLLGVDQFPTTATGHKKLLGWLQAFGTVVKVGVEGTGSYGLAWPAICAGRGWRSWKWTAPTARSAGGRAPGPRGSRGGPRPWGGPPP